MIALNEFRTNALSHVDARANARNVIATQKKVSASYDATLATTVKQLNDDAIASALLAANVDASHYETTQLNAIKKENFILTYLHTRNAVLRDYIAEIFASIYALHTIDTDAYFSKDDAKHALTKSYAASESEKLFLVQATQHYDDSTISSQHKTTLDALVNLNMITYHSNAKHKHAYRLNSDSELAQAFAVKLDIVRSAE